MYTTAKEHRHVSEGGENPQPFANFNKRNTMKIKLIVGMMDDLKGKVVESTSITDSECQLTIKFTDGTTLEIRLDSWDFDRYKLEIDIN